MYKININFLKLAKCNKPHEKFLDCLKILLGCPGEEHTGKCPYTPPTFDLNHFAGICRMYQAPQ